MTTLRKWHFSNEQLLNSPSLNHGYDANNELSCRQFAADLIQDIGKLLHVSFLCINTAIVYMHRFYVFHSFGVFHGNSTAVAALFLASKYEEQPRKMYDVLNAAHICLKENISNYDLQSPQCQKEMEELIFLEQVLLETLGFDLRVEHPHSFVLKICNFVHASKELTEASYYITSYCWHLTKMCLQHPPSTVACVGFYLACKWTSSEIPKSKDGKEWYHVISNSVSFNLIKELGMKSLKIFKTVPEKFHGKVLLYKTSTLKVSLRSLSDIVLRNNVELEISENESDTEVPIYPKRNVKFIKFTEEDKLPQKFNLPKNSLLKNELHLLNSLDTEEVLTPLIREARSKKEQVESFNFRNNNVPKNWNISLESKHLNKITPKIINLNFESAPKLNLANDLSKKEKMLKISQTKCPAKRPFSNVTEADSGFLKMFYPQSPPSYVSILKKRQPTKPEIDEVGDLPNVKSTLTIGTGTANSEQYYFANNLRDTKMVFHANNYKTDKINQFSSNDNNNNNNFPFTVSIDLKNEDKYFPQNQSKIGRFSMMKTHNKNCALTLTKLKSESLLNKICETSTNVPMSNEQNFAYNNEKFTWVSKNASYEKFNFLFHQQNEGDSNDFQIKKQSNSFQKIISTMHECKRCKYS